MAYWQSGAITTINTGTNPNDGTGDDIRTSFEKTDTNFSNIAGFLSGESVDFLNANIAFTFRSNVINVGNLTVANVVAESTFLSNINMAANIVPTVDATYDLGSPTRQFRKLYVTETVSTTQIAASSDAGLLLIHANVGAATDVGILGNVTDAGSAGANSYAFFGYQYATDNFVYKITPTNATKGNGIVYDGTYGNVQFGSAFLSNVTQSTDMHTGALVVNGGVGIVKDLRVGGNIYSNSYPVITMSSSGIGQIINGSGSLFTGNTVFGSMTPSTSTVTGAIVVIGGVGIGGNLVASNVNSNFYGPYYGTVQTPAQPNITSVGSLTSLNVVGSLNAGSLQTTSIGVTNITATGNVNVSTINGLVGLQVTGNTTSTGFVGTNFWGALQTAAQPNITSTGALTVPSLTTAGNVTAGNVNATKGVFTSIDGTLTTASQTAITAVGTLSSLTVSGNTAINNTVYSRGVYDNSNRVLSTTAGAGNLTISGTQVTLTPIGPGASTVGSTTAIPVITTDPYGRVTATTTAAVSTTLNTSGTTGTGSIALLTQSLAVTGGSGVTTSASGQGITVTSTDTLATVTGRGATTSTAVTFNGQINVGASIVPTANLSYNLGSTSNWFNTFYGVSSQAQYADLAEKYTSDKQYEPGTVVVFGGTHEVTVTSEFADARVAGAVSTDPAYLMNAMSEGVAVALRGRIPVKVIGPVQKGDLLVTSTTPGYAQSVGNDRLYSLSVFAKSLVTDLSTGEKVIEAVII